MPSGAETRPWLFGVARNVRRRGNEPRDRTASAASALAAEVERSGAVYLARDVAGPEVAAVLGLTANVVRVRAHRARAKLKAALANQAHDRGPEPELTLSLPPPTR